MQVIGAGWPRTGTTSLRHALQQLRFGPCHHMISLSEAPHTIARWEQLEAGAADASAFADLAASVDNPGCSMWRELLRLFPETKVILGIRDRDSWYASYMQAIQPNLDAPRPDDPTWQRIFGLLDRQWIERSLGGSAHDREACLAAFDAHTVEVKATVPAHQLLVFQAGEGWEPLCAFLGVPVPDVPYPHRNTREFVAEHGVHER